MLRLLSTDFDGTLFAEFENPAIPPSVQTAIGTLQARGAKWVINTGRDLSSLMEALARAHIAVAPDFLVLVEREIYQREDSSYVGLADWNARCARLHAEIFAGVQPDLPRLTAWVNRRGRATVYADCYSPFCVIAGNLGEADSIHDFLTDYSRSLPGLAVMRNDVYMRLCHAEFNKGTALTEISRLLNLNPEVVFAAGDHLNDLPMLDTARARWLAAPANAIPQVKAAVRRQGGHVSDLPHGDGVAEALEFFLEGATAGALPGNAPACR